MQVVTIDGESVSPWGYCLLCSSASGRLSEQGRLTSRECFEFLLKQAEGGPRLFGYGIGYDVCHWVMDLTDDEKTRMATKGMVYTQQGATVYRLIYRPNAYFTVQRMKGLAGSPVTGTATVVDLMRWHRKPFVDACEEWFPYALIYRHCREFKANRSGFTSLAIPSITAYCETECQLAKRLSEEMLARLGDLEIPLSHPFTAGAVAGALMARHRIHNHWAEPPPAVSNAVSRAFFGGREQCSRYGLFRDVTQWDIRSAYGWAMTQLPDMLGRWVGERFDISEPRSNEWSLYKVQWDIDEGRHPVMPFPWRAEDGRVHYPPRGTGWHWSPIVRAALRNYPGSSIRILDAWHYIPRDSSRPFGYVNELFHERRNAGDNPVSSLIKSIIVATWGRLCSPGQRRSKTRGMLDWAGMTTALIQERMLDAIHATGEGEFISCCVDGFWTSNRNSRLSEDASLGGWSNSSANELLLLRPACYWKREGEDWTAHTSGVPGGGGLLPAAMEQWRTGGWRNGRLDLTQRRCKGLLACSADGDYTQLGQFIDLPLSLAFNPGAGRMGHECPTMKHGDGWRRWLNYWPPQAILTAESSSFKSRTGIVDDRWKERQEANAIEETSE